MAKSVPEIPLHLAGAGSPARLKYSSRKMGGNDQMQELLGH